jgi:Uncharacterized conserved protein (DUF2267)
VPRDSKCSTRRSRSRTPGSARSWKSSDRTGTWPGTCWARCCVRSAIASPWDSRLTLGAQLPLLVRGTYYDQWVPAEEPQKWRSEEEFLAVLSEKLRSTRPVAPAQAATAVFMVLNHRLDPGQVGNVRQSLPQDVRKLWPVSNADARQGEAIT